MSNEESVSNKLQRSNSDEDISKGAQIKKNQRWGKMLRKSLGIEPQGKISFDDSLKNDTLFHTNFKDIGVQVPSSTKDIIIYRLDKLSDIESLFKSDKSSTEKKWSLSYGRQNIYSRLVPPLTVSYTISSCKIHFEGTYKSSPYHQEIESYWHDSKRESLRASIKERLLAKPQNKGLKTEAPLESLQLPLLTLDVSANIST
jgi:hypothetical protein